MPEPIGDGGLSAGGIYTYSITEYTSERDRTLIVQIPHLSRFPTDAGVPCGS